MPAHHVYKIGEFIYPWGGGHYSRMMKFDDALKRHMKNAGYHSMEVHYSSKDRIYQRLQERFGNARGNIHEILMPTPIDGSMGPSLSKSLANILLPIERNPALVTQIASYLRQERKLYDTHKFDLAINDGDIGSNILAKNRDIPCLFVTNQFRPKLYKTRSYLYPALAFVSRQIAKATKILVADSPPPHTICQYNLNFTDDASKKVVYVGHFTDIVGTLPKTAKNSSSRSDLERLLENDDGCFGYWMRTGNKSTNDGTGKRYEKVFAQDEMAKERRLVSHARSDAGIDCVTGADKKTYTIAEAADKKIDWVQIDVGFLSDQDKDMVLGMCQYAVINGSHTVMGEIMGGKEKPIIGVPIYDEHTNNIKWAADHKLGIMANSTGQIISAIRDMKHDRSGYASRLAEFAKNFDGQGAQNTARIAAEILQGKG